MFRTQISSLLYLIVFAPLVGAAVNGLLSRWLPRKAVTVIGVGAPVVSFLAAILAGMGFLGLRADDPAFGSATATLFNWISAGPIHIDFSLYLDPLSIVMVLVVTGIGSLIHLYSVGYMHGDPSYARYFSH
ncbi:MAG: NADH-quinone oxidoreductase subunit L, partial [Deltaproteobacteria bacterium]|nr:NADH-quinone oxidoreductase subunit L [Deltaproteobacteria bacterium]